MFISEDVIFIIDFPNRDKQGRCCGIYGIRNKKNDFVYVGQTKQPFYKRYQLHDWHLRQNKHDNQHLQNAYNFYGEENFEFVVIEAIDNPTVDLLNQKEIDYIAQYRSVKRCYNILSGGGGRLNTPMTEQAKRLIGMKNKVGMLGKKHSDETKRKMSESHRGKKLSKKQVEQIRKRHIGFQYTEASKEKMRMSHLGNNNKHSKITEEQAAEIKRLLMANWKQSEIANKFNIDRNIVNSIISLRAWSHIYVEGFDEFAAQYSLKRTKPLSDELVSLIKSDLLDNVLNSVEIAKKYNVSVNSVRGIKQNRSYKKI